MKGYINIPDAINCKLCKSCGARPVIAFVEPGDYLVKCPNDDNHYQTPSGLIDIEDWNLHNSIATPADQEVNSSVAV